jgi:PAS domain S-box-containing protein
MRVDKLPYLLPYLASLLLSLGVGLYTWRRRYVPGANFFAAAVWAEAFMTLGYILELSSDSLAAKIWWDNVQWVGTVLVPTAGFLFAVNYTGRSLARPGRTWFWLLILPTLFILLLLTNPLHGLTPANPLLVAGEPFSALVYDFTLPVYVISLYIYLPMLAAFFLLGRLFFQSHTLYRWQTAVIMAGFFLPLISGILTLAGVTLTFQRDTTPITFAIGNLLIAWGLFRFRLFDLTPVAREVVVENMADAVFVLDEQNRLVDMNPAGRALFAPAAAPSLGTTAAAILSRWTETAERYLTGTTAEKNEWVSAGEPKEYMACHVSPIWNRQGRLIGRVVTLRDITTRKRAEEQLRQRTVELEQMNQELEAARLAAVQADQMKSQFLASMSHELRTPLNAILNFTEMTALGMVGPVNERQKDVLNKSLASSRHLLSLINDVLDITKIQAGMLALYIEEDVNLYTELETVLATAETLLQGKPVRLVRDVDEGVPCLSCDRRRVRQILLNLLANAAKFTQAGTVTLCMKRREGDVLFAVSDTGPGIPAEKHSFIFEPFVQTETGIQHAGGSGLGLAISKKLAEAHGGRLWVESEVGDGAAFYLTLPLNG